MRRGRGQHGVTLVEILMSLAVVGIAAGLVFGVQVRMTSALHDQQKIAEVQQTLRSAASVLARELRQAGYLATSVYATPWNGGGAPIGAVFVLNRKNGDTDEVHVQSAADDCTAHVCDAAGRLCPKSGPSFKASETEVDDDRCFHDGDLAYAVHTTRPQLGVGCVLAITHDPQSSAAGANPKIQHDPGQGAPWNQPTNKQCDALGAVWNDGYTIVTKIRLRAYRIKPGDARGVLQVSNSGGSAHDWEDIALGIVDMQFALRVWHFDPHDHDGDGDANRDWFSGDQMETVLNDLAPADSKNPASQLLMVTMTLVAKTTKEVNGVLLAEVPSLIDPAFAAQNGHDLAHNRQSDRGAVALPVTDPTSTYHGDVVYRVYTTTIDLRNVGIGIDGH